MTGARTVPGFRPSVNGFRFANRWPAGPAMSWRVGLLRIGLGDTALGLCGGMAYVVRDRFERGDPGPPDDIPPDPGTDLFREVVRRQIDSFDRLVVVPIRFWLAALASPRRRARSTVRDAWPEIRRQVDAGHPAVVGVLRTASPNPSLLGVNHQVLAYGYAVSRDRAFINVYDPNHPGDDDVTIELRVEAGTLLQLSQSTGEPIHALLALPYVPPRGQGPRAPGG